MEKHFTIDNNLPGQDNKFALLQKIEMKTISNYRNIFSKMSVNKGLDVQECEMNIYKIMREDGQKIRRIFNRFRIKNEEC